MSYFVTEIAAGHSACGPVRPEQGRITTYFSLLWLIVALPLMTVKLIALPHNLILVDLWVAGAMAVFWFLFVTGYQTIQLTPYVIPLWLILVGSLLSTFASPSVSHSVVVLVKEIYLFAWFLTMATAMSRMSARHLRLILLTWLATVVLHGGLIIAEFLSPELWRFIAHLGDQAVDHEHYRPSGLFVTPKAGNANKAAFFQLMGFIPLVLTSESKVVSLVLAAVLLGSLLATGSMGAIVALSAGVVVGLVIVLLLSRNLRVLLRASMYIAMAAAIVSAVLFASLDRTNQNHLRDIVLGRADKSSSGRFALWKRGIGVLAQQNRPLIAGVGPENFRVVDGRGNQLHNDLLAFVVERGLIGAAGLVLLGGVAFARALSLLQLSGGQDNPSRARSVVFIAAMVTITAESLTHQVFHSRELWLVLAVQEAYVMQILSGRRSIDEIHRNLVGRES